MSGYNKSLPLWRLNSRMSGYTKSLARTRAKKRYKQRSKEISKQIRSATHLEESLRAEYLSQLKELSFDEFFKQTFKGFDFVHKDKQYSEATLFKEGNPVRENIESGIESSVMKQMEQGEFFSDFIRGFEDVSKAEKEAIRSAKKEKAHLISSKPGKRQTLLANIDRTQGGTALTAAVGDS